jgi:membrane protease YdiL (CAAX protease family)
MTTPDKPSAASTLRDFAAYLRAPALLDPEGLRGAGSARRWAVLLALQIAGLALLLPLLHLWQKAFSLPAPDAFNQIPPAWLPWIVVGIAPLLEELLFRGWQSGRPRALVLLVGVAFFSAALLAVRPENIAVTGSALLAIALVTGLGWYLLRRRAAPLWFRRLFPAIFYLGAALFALPHLLNYPSVSLLALPLVLPQAWAGLTLGYIRQKIGLTAAILAHAASNGTMLVAAMLIAG